MGYQLSFEGVASVELSRLIDGVERRLNLHGLSVQGGPSASTAVPPSSVVPCPKGQICPDSHGPHIFIIVAAAIVVLGIGAWIGVQLGQSLKAKDIKALQGRAGGSNVE